MVDRCVMCGEIIPEGRQICPICEKGETKVESQKWISVKERLPKKDGDYLCYKKSGLYEVFGFAKDGRKKHKYDFFRDWKNVWFFYASEYGYVTTDSVTHWMPLPEPPKGE